jgi:hypothetical protein
MPLPKISVKLHKDGREVARFRDSQGLVRTRAGITAGQWTRAEQIRDLADYGILLQLDQASKGLGSSGTPMPPLKAGQRRYAGRRDGVVVFANKTVRNLYGPGKDGHMLDDVRVNYVDDKKATITISRKSSRDKARANEKKSPWWGWSPESVMKLRQRSAEIFGTGVTERLFEMGLIGVSALAFVKSRALRTTDQLLRRAA